MNDELKDAVKLLTEELVKDPDYRRAWTVNIAVAFQDEFNENHLHQGVHSISNTAAENFINMLCREVEKGEKDDN